MRAPDPDIPADEPEPDHRSGRWRRWLGLTAATVLPGLIAAIAVLLIAGGDETHHADARATPPRSAELLVDRAEAKAAARQAAASRPERRRRPAIPRTISIPAVGMKAPIDPVPVENGSLQIPSVRRAGWYDGGPRPGEPGRAVIVGHLDTQYGPAVFGDVPMLKPGTKIRVTDARGAVHSYRAVGHAEVRKDAFPTDSVYGASEQPVLVLVTCGGPFIAGRGYRDNILLFAHAA